MTERPPSLTKQDVEHLRILVILHYVVAGLSVLGLGFLVLHFLVFNFVMGQQNGPLPPGQFLWIVKVFYAVVGGFILVSGTLNLVSASNLRERRRRTLILFVAAANCLQFPLGTALGVFTFIVLTRDSVRDVFEYAENTDGWFEARDPRQPRDG